MSGESGAIAEVCRVPLFDETARDNRQAELASLIRRASALGPFGPNSLDIIQRGGTVHMTGAESESAARAVIESEWLADLLAAERQRGREEALREAADGYLDCLCGHEIEWHHEERGCQYLGNNPQRRCRCLRDAHTAVGDRLRALADVPAAAEGERE